MFSFDQLVVHVNSLLEITSVIMLIHVLNVGKSRFRLLNFVLFYICLITYLVWVNLFMESKELFALGLYYPVFVRKMAVSDGDIAGSDYCGWCSCNGWNLRDDLLCTS